MKKIILMSLIASILLISMVSSTVLDFSRSEGIFASSCNNAFSFDETNPLNNIRPTCQDAIITNNSNLDLLDNTYVDNYLMLDKEGFYYFEFNTSNFEVSSMTASIYFKTTDASTSNFYWYIYNYSASDWYLLGSYPTNLISRININIFVLGYNTFVLE